MQHSFSNENFLKPHNMSLPYKSNYCHDISLPQQKQNKQLYRNYSKQSLSKYGKQSSKYPKQYPQPSNDYYPSHNQRIGVNKHNSVVSPKGVISDNSIQQQEKHSPQRLKKRIKQIKTALKIAQEHNEQLHIKLNHQKKTTNQQLISYEKDINKYKSLYQIMIDNYEKKLNELNETRRELEMKREEVNELKMVGIGSEHPLLRTYNQNNSTQQLQSQHVQMKQLLTKQQVTLQHLSHENKLLRQELLLKNKKLSEYEIVISTYQTQQKLNKSHSKLLSQLQAKINQLEIDNQKALSQNTIYTTKISRLQIDLQSTRNQLISAQSTLSKTLNENQQLKITNSQLNSEIKSNQQLINDYQTGERKGKWKHMLDELTLKYNELLKSNYQTQKDFEKQLHLITNQIQRRQILKYNHR